MVSVPTYDKENVHIVWLEEQEEPCNVVVKDLVIVSFATESKEILVHVDVVTTAIDRAIIQFMSIPLSNSSNHLPRGQA